MSLFVLEQVENVLSDVFINTEVFILKLRGEKSLAVQDKTANVLP